MTFVLPEEPSKLPNCPSVLSFNETSLPSKSGACHNQEHGVIRLANKVGYDCKTKKFTSKIPKLLSQTKTSHIYIMPLAFLPLEHAHYY